MADIGRFRTSIGGQVDRVLPAVALRSSIGEREHGSVVTSGTESKRDLAATEEIPRAESIYRRGALPGRCVTRTSILESFS